MVSEQAGYSTMIFMMGWALGGVVFGILGDRLGRAKTMIITILLYSGFTGLSYFSRSVWDFNVYRFLCSLGVGGQFAVGVALIGCYWLGATLAVRRLARCHPLGASGARLITMLVHELERRGGRYGLATMCIGVGQGVATVIERL
jgi:MFS family permease